MRRKRWLLAAAAVVLLVFALGANHPRPVALLDRSTRVADAAAWSGQGAGYAWVSDHELLIYQPGAAGRWSLARRDLHTGREVPLGGAARLLQHSGALPDSLRVSPDGARLLWRAAGNRIEAANLEGGNRFSAPTTPICDCCWLGDSRHWVEMRTARQGHGIDTIVVHEVGQQAEMVVHPNPHAYFMAPERWVQPNRLYDALRSDNVSDTSFVFTGYDMTTGTMAATTTTVHVPNALAVSTVCSVLSPWDDRVAWFFSRSPLPSPALWLQRHLPGTRGGPPVRYLLSTSGMSGEHMREFGELPEEPQDVRWVPGGKAVSFVYHGSLWTTPVH